MYSSSQTSHLKTANEKTPDKRPTPPPPPPPARPPAKPYSIPGEKSAPDRGPGTHTEADPRPPSYPH